MKNLLSEKIAGCLIGAAYGDALGAPTENRTREQIFEKWGYVDQLHDAPADVYARGNKAGQVTDDFSMAYVAIQEILRSDCRVNRKVAEGALIEWSKNERFFEQFVGPTSRKFINRLKGIESESSGFEPVNDNMRASNGGAMKIGPVACFGKGDMEKTIDIAKVICMPTHGNRISMSAACAVAAAVCGALNGKDLFGIFKDAMSGAERGEAIGAAGNTVAGPSFPKRLRFAIELGMNAKDLSEAMDVLRSYFDCSGMAADSVPVSFGLMAAAKGDVMAAVQAAANIGNDTDTMATIVGAVLGAKNGVHAFPEELVRKLDEANGYDLCALAETMEATDVVIG